MNFNQNLFSQSESDEHVQNERRGLKSALIFFIELCKIYDRKNPLPGHATCRRSETNLALPPSSADMAIWR